MADPDCIFCKILAGELPATIVDEDERTIAFMDIAPATRGHALVIPRAHAADLLSVDTEDLAAVARRLAAAGRARARAPRRGRRQPDQLLRRGRLADGLPLPRPRDSPLQDDPLRLPWAPVPGRSAGDRSRRAGTRRELSEPSHRPLHLPRSRVEWQHMRRISIAILASLALVLALPAGCAGDAHRSRRDRRDHARRPPPAAPARPAWRSAARPGSRSRSASAHNPLASPRSGTIVAWTISPRQAQRHPDQVLQRQRGRAQPKRRSRSCAPSRSRT